MLRIELDTIRLLRELYLPVNAGACRVFYICDGVVRLHEPACRGPYSYKGLT